jgi:hypothetical protein
MLAYRILFFRVQDVPIILACIFAWLFARLIHSVAHRQSWDIFTWEPRVFLGSLDWRRTRLLGHGLAP